MKKNYKSFTAGELSEEMYGRYDVDKYGTGCMILVNWLLMSKGGVKKRPGTKFSSEAGNSEKKVRLIRFEFSTEQAYCLEFGDQYMRVFKNREQVTEAPVNITAATSADPVVVTANAHGYSNGDEVYIASVGGMWELNGRNFLVAGVTTNTFQLQDLEGNDIDGSAFTAYTSGGTVAKVYEIATPYTEDQLFDLYYTQSADVMTLCHLDHDVKELSRTGHTAWTLSTASFAPSIGEPTISASRDTGSGSTTYSYKATAVNEEDLEESLESNTASITNDLSTSGNANEIEITATVTGAVKYNIYKEKSGTYGFIGSTESTTFIDDNIDPDISITPPRARNPFSGTNDKPSVVNFHQQRRIFAATRNQPDGIWMSRAGMYNNMSISIPNQDDDAITFRIASGRVNKINHLVPFRDLLVMTKDQEWKVGANGPYTPTTIEATPETDYGSDKIRPIIIGNSALFGAKYGLTIRDYAYTFEADGYDGNELSVLSDHLFKDRYIVDWTFAQEPNRLVWSAMSDGICCSLTYMREHRIWGWARQITQGDIESTCTVPNETERTDDVYMLVKRNINGVDKRFIEVLQKYVDDPVEDAYFVDCGLSYNGSPTTEIRGLWHLEGEEVRILADGNVLPNQEVTGGKITLDRMASKVHVGLYYKSEIQPMTPEGDMKDGSTTKGEPKAISTLQAEVLRTRGLFAGQSPDDDVFSEMYPIFPNLDLSASIETFTGIVEFAVEGSWNDAYVAPYVYHDLPLPAKILSINAEFK